MEEARAREKNKLNELKDTLYERQRDMQYIQTTLEEIAAKNNRLEQDFEKEINNKNQNSKEIGQIIRSIENIAAICTTQIDRKGRGNKKDKEGGGGNYELKEDTPQLVSTLVDKLRTAHQTVQELVQVHEAYG